MGQVTSKDVQKARRGGLVFLKVSYLIVPWALAAQDVVKLENLPAASPRSAAITAALEEFRVQATKLGSAQTGSGGSDASRTAARPAWHGRVYENIRNDAFDAIPHQIVQRGGEQRKLRRNQYGFSVSGPIVIPKVYSGTGKTFFTMSYEGMQESIGQFRMMTVPTTLERTGSWGHVVDPDGKPLAVYDPATTTPNPNYDPSRSVSASNLQYLRQMFPGNVIPDARMDPVARRALQYYPQPNTDAGPFYQNNFYSVTPEVNKANGFILSVDHSFLQKHRVTVRMSKSNGTQGNAPIFLTLANPANPPQATLTRALNIDHVFTASPTNVNTLRFSADSNRYAAVAQLDESGKPFPRYNFANIYQSMGQQNPTARTAFNNFQLSDTFATRWTSHRLSIGIEQTQHQVNVYQAAFPEGRFEFNAGLTSLPGIINTGHPFASFLLGLSSQAQQSVVTSPSYFKIDQTRVIFSDQWQPMPSLTITIGANLESFGQRVEKYNRQSTIAVDVINPENNRPGALVAANTYGYGRAFQPRWTKVEPALGIAWSVLGDNNTVIRANYDRRYANSNVNGNQFGTQAFNGSPLWLSANTQLSPAVVLQDGLRGGQTFPDLRPEAANGTTVDYFDTSNRQPTTQNFNASIQRQLAPFLILTVSYNYQYGRNERVGSNAANPNALSLSALQYRDQLNNLEFNRNLRPYPQYQDFNVNGFLVGRHINKNWNFQLEKRTSGGLALTFSYGYQWRMDDYSSNVQDYYNLKAAWSRSSFINPHQLTASYIYELPFGPGKAFLTRGPLSHIFGGWAFNGTWNFYSGSPVRLQPLFNNTGGVIPAFHLYVDDVPGVNPHLDSRSPHLWFNPDAFLQPADFMPGNAPRVHPTLTNPNWYNHDLTLNKRVTAGAGRSVEFIASLFNATNHANWNNPDSRIGTRQAPNINAGKIIGSNGGRIVQLGLRFNF